MLLSKEPSLYDKEEVSFLLFQGLTRIGYQEPCKVRRFREGYVTVYLVRRKPFHGRRLTYWYWIRRSPHLVLLVIYVIDKREEEEYLLLQCKDLGSGLRVSYQIQACQRNNERGSFTTMKYIRGVLDEKSRIE